jgi:dihydrolipoamide dehydrogenase
LNERTCDVAIIGAGTAGLKAYKAAVARGADVVIVERGPGGSTCTRVGCMPSKLLIAAARVAYQARKAGEFGIVTGEVSVDAAKLWSRVRQQRDRFVDSVLDDYHAISADRVVHGSARFTGPRTIAVGDDRITARRGIIIATGGHPIIAETLDPVRDLVHTHETIFELADLPATMAVLGAGALGLELAQAFARLGVAVTVIDQGEMIGGLKDPKTNAAAIAAIGEEFAFQLGVDASAALTDDGRARLSWSGGAVEVDLVLAATGRPPALDGLDLDTTGIALDDHGTPVFEKSTRRCGDSDIFIAGDANAWRPVLHEAARGGRIAGDVAMGGPSAKPLPAFAIAFTEPNLTEVGISFDALPEGVRIGEASVADNGRATADGEDQGLVRLYADADGKLLGASIVAPEGEHLGHLVALAIERGMDAAAFADQAWYHPTLEELLQSAARDLLGDDG